MSRDNGFPPAMDGISHNGVIHADVDELVAAYKPRAHWTLESAVDIAAAGIAPIEFDIDTLLTRDDGPALLFGPPGSLKSFFAMHVCRCVATGEPVLGKYRVRRRARAIFINFDAGRQATRRRIMNLAPGVPNLFLTSPEGFDAGSMSELFAQNEDSFIVLDCFSDMYSSNRGEDQSETMRRFVHDLRTLYEKHGCNGLVIDHPRRAREGETVGDYYGSVQKEAALRTMWIATPLHSDEPRVGKVKIVSKKMGEAERFPPFAAKVTFGLDTIDFAFDGRVDEFSGAMVEAPRDFELLETLLRGVAGGMSRPALESRLGWGRDRVLAAVRDSKDVAAIGKGPSRRYALLSEINALQSIDASAGDSEGTAADLGVAPAEAAQEAIVLAPVTWEPLDSWIVTGLAEIDDSESEPQIRRVLTVGGLSVPPGAADHFIAGLVKYALDEMLVRESFAEPHPYRESRRSWRVKTRRRCVRGCACTVPTDAPCDCIAWRAGGTCACGQPMKPESTQAAQSSPRRIAVSWLFDGGEKPWLVPTTSEPPADNT